MEIVPSVHAVGLLGSTAFLIVEDELTLIDAGLAGSGHLLRRYLARIGRRPDEIARIVCTHAHPITSAACARSPSATPRC